MTDRSRSQCPRCNFRAARAYDLQRHARRKHGVTKSAMKLYKMQVKALNAKGTRRTLRANFVETALQDLPETASRRQVADYVLRAAGVTVSQDGVTVTPRRQPTETLDDDVENRNGFIVQPIARPEGTKRLHRVDIAGSGFVTNFAELGATAKAFERLHAAVQGTTKTTAKQRAGLLHRYLCFAKKNYPEMTDLDALLSVEAANHYVEQYGRFFARQSTINAILAVVKALSLLRFCEDFKRKVGFQRGMERKLTRAADHWANIGRTNARKARVEQRVKMVSTPNREWTINLPMSILLDYLRSAGQTFLGVERRANDRLPQVHETLTALRSACSLCLVLNGIRQVIALRMTPAHLREATTWDGNFIVKCPSHKTQKTHGPGFVVLKPHQMKLFVRLSRWVDDEEKLFGVPETCGDAAAVLFEDFNLYVKARLNRDFTMRFKHARREAETYAHFLDGETKSKVGHRPSDVVTKFLLHTPRNRNLYYAFATDSEIVSRCRLYQELLAVLAALELIKDEKILVPALPPNGMKVTFCHNVRL